MSNDNDVVLNGVISAPLNITVDSLKHAISLAVSTLQGVGHFVNSPVLDKIVAVLNTVGQEDWLITIVVDVLNSGVFDPKSKKALVSVIRMAVAKQGL